MNKPKVKFPPDPFHDNGRRGDPRVGCDCMQCFGMCIIDREAIARETRLRMQERGEGDE